LDLCALGLASSSMNNLITCSCGPSTAAQNVTLDGALQIEEGAVATSQFVRSDRADAVPALHRPSMLGDPGTKFRQLWQRRVWGLCAGASIAANFGVTFAVTSAFRRQ
jgi:hypothetical protein